VKRRTVGHKKKEVKNNYNNNPANSYKRLLGDFAGVKTQEMEKGKFVIVDFRTMDFMKDKEGKINVYDTQEEASDVCGIYEFENAWVCKLIYNHKEED
jgi:hypothetical protein